ncbi:MAG: acyl-CoA reductase [Chthoniobacteraceae bacterium]
MNTLARATALAEACQNFPFLGPSTTDDLLAMVIADFGSATAPDEMQPPVVLHILAGNTPAAALQTLVRGLLLGAHNLAKLPSAGLPEVDEFIARLPAALAAQVETSTTLPEWWLERADSIVVFGDDETIAHFRARVRADQRFIAHGHKVSFGATFDDPTFASVEDAARDVAAFDQLGCLSPHALYVGGDARAYAAKLATALERIPRGAFPLSAASAIRALREDFAFRAANGEPCAVWCGANSTVIYDETPGFPRTPLHRTIFVKPLPADWSAELQTVREHLSCAGVFPDGATLAGLGIGRICPIGLMQFPPWTWHQDGVAPLASLLKNPG